MTAASLFPGDLDANLLLYRSLRSVGRTLEAAVILQRLVKIQPNSLVPGGGGQLSAELEILANDAATVNTSSTDQQQNDRARCSLAVLDLLPKDVAALIKLKIAAGSSTARVTSPTGDVGFVELSKRMEVLAAGLSQPQVSKVYVSQVVDLLERLVNTHNAPPNGSLRSKMCLTFLPRLFSNVNSAVSGAMSLNLIRRCLLVSIADRQAQCSAPALDSLAAVDSHWLSCLQVCVAACKVCFRLIIQYN